MILSLDKSPHQGGILAHRDLLLVQKAPLHHKDIINIKYDYKCCWVREVFEINYVRDDNLKIKLFSDDYYHNFNSQIKCIKDSVLTLEEAIKLLQRQCLNEMEDKCKIVAELENEAKSYGKKLNSEKELFLGPDQINISIFYDIMDHVGEKAKLASEILIRIKNEKISEGLTSQLVKLIENDENISRNMYLTIKKMEKLDINEINKLSNKIEKNQKEVEEIMYNLFNDHNRKINEDLSADCKELINILKDISEESKNVSLLFR